MAERGLHLLIPIVGSKLWRLAYRYGGKQKTLALGPYLAISLSDARHRRDLAKRLLAAGVDPAEQAKLDKIAKNAFDANTFASVADEYLRKVEREGKAKATIIKKRMARPACKRLFDGISVCANVSGLGAIIGPGQDGAFARVDPHKAVGVERHFFNQDLGTPFDCQAIFSVHSQTTPA